MSILSADCNFRRLETVHSSADLPCCPASPTYWTRSDMLQSQVPDDVSSKAHSLDAKS